MREGRKREGCETSSKEKGKEKKEEKKKKEHGSEENKKWEVTAGVFRIIDKGGT